MVHRETTKKKTSIGNGTHSKSMKSKKKWKIGKNKYRGQGK